jgi:hypothetical protein
MNMARLAIETLRPAFALVLAAVLAVPTWATAGALAPMVNPYSSALPGRVASPSAAAHGLVHQVHDDWNEDRWERRRYRDRYWRPGHVRAPFTRVETRGYRHSSVDAPFASVRVRPWGVWVRAPFVDLYVPR